MVCVYYCIYEFYKIFLMVVCEMGYVSIVELLINVGVNVNFNDGDKILLIVVCGNGDLNVVEELIKVGFNVNFSDGDKILLIFVCG